MTGVDHVQEHNVPHSDKQTQVNKTEDADVDHVEIKLEQQKSFGYVRGDADLDHLPRSPVERRLVWKADLLILPLSGILFLVAYMVRIKSIRK